MKYRRVSSSLSGIEKQETGKLARQTVLIFLATIFLLVLIILIGIPALIRLSVFLGDLRASPEPVTANDVIPPPPPQLSTLPTATSSGKLDLSGYAEAGSQVDLYHNNAKLTQINTGPDGRFQFTSISLTPDINRFTAKAIDQAGNISPFSAVISISFDDQAPTLTITSPFDGQQFFGISQQTLTILGSTGTDCTVTVNDRHIVVDQSGSFTTRLQLNEGDNHLEVTTTDIAGNTTSKSFTVKFFR